MSCPTPTCSRSIRARRGRSPGPDRRVVSTAGDPRKMIIHAEGGEDPGGYYFRRLRARATSETSARTMRAVPERLVRAAVQITYKAADGLEINALLTLPTKPEPHGLPLIVLPHDELRGPRQAGLRLAGPGAGLARLSRAAAAIIAARTATAGPSWRRATASSAARSSPTCPTGSAIWPRKAWPTPSASASWARAGADTRPYRRGDGGRDLPLRRIDQRRDRPRGVRRLARRSRQVVPTRT